MKPRILVFVCGLLLLPGLLLGSCSGIPGTAPAAGSTPIPTQMNELPNESATPTADVIKPKKITIWLPDKLSNRGIEEILPLIRAQIGKYQVNHPGISVEVRVKNARGAANLMDTLQNASLAAPEVLPDLVLLSREEMEVAALKGLLIPFDGVTDILSANDWIEPVRQLADIQGSTFGMPVFSDALVYIYPSTEVDPPVLFAQGKPTLCFLNDPKAYIPMLIYLKAGGMLADQTGKPMVDHTAFVTMLETISQSRQTGAFPPWMMDLSQPDDVYRYYTSGRGKHMMAWYSDTALPILSVSNVTAIRNNQGEPASLVRGWFWGMTQPEPFKRSETVALAEMLSEEAFLANLAKQASLLPVRRSPTVLEDTSLAGMSEIVSTGQPIPDGLFLVTISPIFQESIRQLYSDVLSPEEIATGLINRLLKP